MPTVLFVDDEPSILEGMRRTTCRESYDVCTAESAADALAILTTTSVDVVVSDERMPGMSGSEFLQRVRVAYPKVVCIMLTGEAGLPLAVRALKEGPLYRFLNKPIHPDELRQTLRQAIYMKHVADEGDAVRRGEGKPRPHA